MAKEEVSLLAFNRGVVSKLALGRVDIKRVSMSAQEQQNWVPRVLGPMSLRPGLQYLGGIAGNNFSRQLPFIFSTTDTALVELTANVLRMRVSEALVTRVAVATAIANGTFDTNLTSWTDNDEAGGVSSWGTGGYMLLLGTGNAAAIRDQTVTVAGGDFSKEHALNITVTYGECILRVGSTAAGTDDLINETTLRPGVHSLAFTPSGANVYVRLMSRISATTYVDSCVIAPAGVMTLATPWGVNDLPNIRYKQSGDVIFIACSGIRQIRIERRSTTSWSVVDYVANLGPFRVENTSPITIAPNAIKGDITLTASAAFFQSTNVGGLIAIDSTGQTVSDVIAGADLYSDPIRVTGIGSGRVFGITVTGTWVGTITLQRSVGSIGSWVDVSSYTTNQSTTLNDTLDNQIIYYRIGIKPASYTSGSATVSLAYSAGTIRGIARITQYTSPTAVYAQVVKDFGALTATVNWLEGSWSPRRGYPSAVGLYEGRVWWAGKDKVIGSVSDDYANFDDSTVGDSGPINRSIGFGPVDTINWLLESQQLLMGAQGAEYTCRSSSLGEPLTPTNFNLKASTSRGSKSVEAAKVDTSAVFVDRSGSRVYEMVMDQYYLTFSAEDLTAICPEIGLPALLRIAVQRRPDTRLHFVRSDGTVAMIVFDKTEDVKAWVTIVTDGVIEDVVTLPGDEEDVVYYTVARTVGGVTVRYLEKWAKQSECVGGTSNKQADAFVYYSGAPTATLSGLSHLEARTVVCWADGKDQGSYLVTGGAIVLPQAVSVAVVGLGYQAKYRSVKMKDLNLRKKINSLGLLLADTHAQGLLYGQDYTTMDDLPQMEQGAVVDANYIWEDYDLESMEFNGVFDTNARLCLVANAPRPCTVVAATAVFEVNAK